MLVFASEQISRFYDIIDRLTDHGIFMFCASFENTAFLCDRKDTGGVIIDLSEAHKKGEQLFQSLRATYPEMPIGAISNPNQPTRLKFTRVISPSTPTDMWCEILSFCVIDCGFRTDSIYTPTLTVSKNAVFYMCEKLPLAPRQHRILQCLAYRAPRSVSTDDLLSLCYPVEPRSVSNLAVQIREINRRAAAINAPPLILSTYATGYRIRNGIFEETLSKE